MLWDSETQITNNAWTPSFTWISRFWSSLGWRSLKANVQLRAEADPSDAPAADAFFAQINIEIQEFQLSPQQVWAFDETGVTNGSPSLRTLVPPGSNDATIIVDGDMSRDTLIVAANQAGETFHMFIEHTDHNPEVGESEFARKRVHGAGIHELVEFSEGFTDQHPEGGILLQDNLKCHYNPNVTAKWSAGGIGSRHIPPYGAKYVSPLDNSVFSAVKSRLRREDTSTKKKKKAACKKVMRNLETDLVQRCFKHCGYKALGEEEGEN
jgi:hypothetical protein